MDTPLLSKMVKELILENDAVTLPGIGTFVAELVPSTFSDKGYTINPPYRRLSFSQREGSDTLLTDIYASSNDVPYATAQQILSDFLQDLRKELMAKKSVVFPELGRLRATRENNFFFIADEDLDIYPDGFGLEPISLKTHEETPEEVSAAVAGLAEMLEEEPVIPAKAEIPVEESPAAAPGLTKEDVEAIVAARVQELTASAQPKPRRKKRVWLRIILILILLAALFFGAFFLAAHFAPDWLDTLLYTPEELEIIRA